MCKGMCGAGPRSTKTGARIPGRRASRGRSVADKRRPGSDATLERGLPVNLDAERMVLGAVLLDDGRWPQLAERLHAEDFSLERHRRIFERMRDLAGRGEKIDRITL